MRGFVIEYWQRGNQATYHQIKAWGFDTVLLPIFWGNISNEDGTLRESWITFMQNQVAMIHVAGLKVIMSFRVQYGNPPASWENPEWTIPPTHDYVNMTSEGLNRYCDFLKKAVSTFPDVDYFCPWHFPYHRQDPDATARQRYVTTTFPAMLQAIRTLTNKTVIFSPIHQGILDLNGQADSDFYLTAIPYSDSNIVYALNHMTKWQVLINQEAWDSDITAIDRAFEGIRVFRQKYPTLPMCSIEFAPWENVPLNENRMAYFKEVLKRMQQYRVGFLYWRIEEGYPTPDIIDALIATNISPPTPPVQAVNLLIPAGIVGGLGLLWVATRKRRRR